MRQGQQQNRRGRGRNRKSQNPLTRSFESNGPDVKIRGTPAHIAEKYISLARDAHSSGDPVLAESYLQHAEHYNRIIMAFREQQIQQGGGDPSQLRRPQGMNDFGDADDFGDDDGDDGDVGVMGLNEPQPSIRSFEPPARQDNARQDNARHQDGGREGGRGEGSTRGEGHGRSDHRGEGRGRGDFQYRQRDRQHGGGGRSNGEQRHSAGHGEAAPEGGRPEPPRREPREAREPREPREPRQDQGGRRGGHEGRQRREFAGAGPAADQQPEFLRRSVRRPRREEPSASESAPETATAEDNAE